MQIDNRNPSYRRAGSDSVVFVTMLARLDPRMRSLSVLLVVLLTACSGCAGKVPSVSQPIVDRQNRVQEMLKRTVEVHSVCSWIEGGGSGVIVDSTHVITAKHVVEGLQADDCDLAVNNKWYKAHVTAYKLSGTVDAAVLELSMPLADVTPVEWRTAEPGERVIVTGYPMQLTRGYKQQLTVTDGLLAIQDWTDELDRITAQVYFGNSGGPVWDEDGKLIGIAVCLFAWDDPLGGFPIPFDGQSGITPVRRMKEFLNAPTM
jgi:S1-C subfamily serine protease